jgi:type IV pilus assembly protein PilE
VLAIIGILVLLALPNFKSVISKAKSTEAKIQLGHLHSLQENYFYIHSRYTENIDDVGFEQQTLITDGGNANYKIEIIEATNNSFRAIATAVADFDGDGIYNVWEINQDKKLEEIEKD